MPFISRFQEPLHGVTLLPRPSELLCKLRQIKHGAKLIEGAREYTLMS